MSKSKANTVKIVSLTPVPTKPLFVGDKVEIKVEVQYKVSSSPVEIGLNIQKGELANAEIQSILESDGNKKQMNKLVSFIISTKREVVSEKKGKRTLKDSFVVPKTDSVHIFTPIMLQGKTATDIVDSRFYKVKARESK